MYTQIHKHNYLSGPSSIICRDNVVYFCDAGPLGETGLHSPTGSVFCIRESASGQVSHIIITINL